MSDERRDAEMPWWPTPDERRAAQAARRRARRPASGPPRAGARRERTTPDAIVSAAITVVDRDGIEALTIRRLAAELGVAPMTVYSYVRSKEEVLDLVVDRVAGEIELPPIDADWRERATQLAHALRSALLAHPDGAALITERPIRSPNAFRLFDAGLGIFRDAGFRDRDAVDAYFAFGDYVMGSIAQQAAALRAARTRSGDGDPSGDQAAVARRLPPARFPNVAALAEHIYASAGIAQSAASEGAEARFDFGLDSLLDGLAARIGRTKEGAS